MSISTLSASSNATSPKVNDHLEISEDLIRRFDSLGPRYTSYPTADRFHTDFTEASYIQYLQQRNQSNNKPPLSLYIHIPFCASLCYYCACNKVITKDRSKSAIYLNYLAQELKLVKQYLTEREVVSQLHLGGGTPTFLSEEEMRGLMAMLRAHFDFADDAEISIEIDPRTVTTQTLRLLAELGFNRTSLGVQDFDEQVQVAVHRIQPYSMVEQCINQSRAVGFQSINFDLIYGLPKQSLKSFARTLDQVIALSPARIALYNYAHLPTRFKPQRRINEADLPSAEQRLQIFLMSLRRLLAEGYVYIGLDHFAKPDDSLALAVKDKSLHRNFQGYTTRADCDLVALGLSSIGKIGASYVQNLRTLDEYYAALDAGHLPVEKGFHLSQDDLLRREIIMDLMCCTTLNIAEIEAKYQISFAEYFHDELERVRFYADEGLLDLNDASVSVTSKGRMFVRAFSMIFDYYLSRQSGAKYSKLI